MANVNEVNLLGNLGRDVELRFTQTGQAVASLVLATNQIWKNKEGNQQKRTDWHRVIVWGKQAENCKQYLSKGRQVFVKGRLQYRKWVDKEGVTRYFTEIVANNVQFLNGAQQQEQLPIEEELPPELINDEGKTLPSEEDIPF